MCPHLLFCQMDKSISLFFFGTIWSSSSAVCSKRMNPFSFFNATSLRTSHHFYGSNHLIWEKNTVACLFGLSKNNCTEDEHSICGSKNYVFYDVIASKKSNFSWLVRRTVPGKLWIFAKTTDLANFLNSIYMRNNLLLLVCTR